MFRLFFIFFLSSYLYMDSQEIKFDKEIIQERLEILNKKTPLDLVYNSSVEKHIKSYIYNAEYT